LQTGGGARTCATQESKWVGTNGPADPRWDWKASVVTSSTAQPGQRRAGANRREHGAREVTKGKDRCGSADGHRARRKSILPRVRKLIPMVGRRHTAR
jgi:hypothetical protein